MENQFFNAHHSPMGAFASFTLGHAGACGGLGMELSGPANQNVYIGLQSKDFKTFSMMPFFASAKNMREKFDNQAQTTDSKPNQIHSFPSTAIKRNYALCTDKWQAEDLSFEIFSPVHAIPDPDTASHNELKNAIIPAVFAEITVDNRACSTERKAVFGFEGNDPYTAMRQLNKTSDNLTGIAQGRQYAICTIDNNTQSAQAFSIDEICFPETENNYSFGLGTTAALVMTAPAGKISTWRFAVCFYRGGIVTTGIDTAYYYTKFWNQIEEVALYGLSNVEMYKKAALDGNRLLENSTLSEERKFMTAHAIRSYYGNTELLISENRPVWVVNEGEYRMINTFDLFVDQLFFEMKMNPWTVRNVLDLYADPDKYRYRDMVKLPESEKKFPGGVSFTHDMGVANSFSRFGHSAYELEGIDGCFSHMTHEQLVNWVLCAGVYAHAASDTKWVNKQIPLLVECLKSMVNRDHYDENLRDGVMDLDSARTAGGAEITTYDNVDSSLGQSRRNTYLAVKCWAAYILLEKMLNSKQKEMSELASLQAHKCAQTILSYKQGDESIPALLEKGNKSVIIPIIEGLVFIDVCCREVLRDSRYSEFVEALAAHCRAVLKKGVCLFDDSGWKLSSTSDNSWLSKIYLCQYITENIFGMDADIEADKAHIGWLLNSQNSYFAFSDQMNRGKVCGSRYYPRGVTAALWLD
ncbi:glycoside hydrolase family 52 protein [Chitinispirillales bacterium ANBcel5]|uniref:glycoside hydrolase family 52 protein n=1 Tax=Cellulosispirillum alkaliphilum TaxID=3039283 RepID=UPI002A51EC9B|nr:glycoside hydrolase family 52 protein [Chitinispirillales bacterium ANBcel5]